MNPTLLKILLLYSFFLNVTRSRGTGSENQLILTNDCPCPGQNLTFECTIVGGGTTVWQGDGVFDCPDFSNVILLRHINFGSSEMGECNAGAIVGRSLRVTDGNRYTSQLSVAYNEQFNGKNVTCAHDDGLAISSRLSLMITQNRIVSFPSPNDVRLVTASPHQLTFSWNPVAPNCAAIHYNIRAHNCGDCPSSTQHNRVVCHNMEVGQNLTCSFSVQNFRICDDVAGSMSIPVNVTLKVPSAPSAVVIPHYSYSTREFVGLTIRFNQLTSFQISNGFDGSTLSYLINFTNSITGTICGSATVQAASCVEGICTDIFHVSSLSCFPLPTGINVTVTGQNVLGNGVDSYPTTVSTEIIQFVTVDITTQASDHVVCTFHHQQNSANREKTCSIAYGPVGSNCKTMTQLSHSFSDTVVIGLPLEDIEQDYCFSVTASNGFLTAIIEGTFKKDSNDTSHQSASCSVALGVSLTTLVLLNTITAIIALIIIFILIKSKQKVALELERAKARETHGMYEELDYMYVDRPKTINTKDNISYSIKAANSELSLYEDMSQNQSNGDNNNL